MGDFAAAGFGVEALDIAALALLEGRGDEDFLEIVGADDLGGHLAHLFGGTDKGGDGDDARIYEEFGHFGDAADILATVLGRETEIGIDTCADIVAIEDAAQAAAAMQLALKGNGYGALARAAQAREPQHDALLAQQRFLVGAAEHLVEYGIDVRHSLVRS